MLRVTPSELVTLQHHTERIRNICILAHVDHGKTTLSDSLVSANGIISEKLAGKIRYLDNTEEEQTRGITMKSSAISLLFMNEPVSNNDSAVDTSAVPYLINLVDSPGHVDFSFDVSTAVRLCDGALVIIDAVEGVCAQTIAVLRQAWQEGIRPCLIINKMDRLIFELQLSPYEACERLHRIIEQANAILSSLIRAEVVARHDAIGHEQQDHQAITNETALLEKERLFSPVLGNVLFASAVDGWAFNIGLFAHVYSKKLETSFQHVRQSLWGEYYYNTKTKKITTQAPSSQSRTLFCQWILEPIWAIYNAFALPITTPMDVENLRMLLKQRRISKLVSDREMQHTDRKLSIQAVMRKWLPLATTVLKMVTRALPNPIVAQQQRLTRLCGPSTAISCQQSVLDSIEQCQTHSDAPVIVFICKMISVEANVLSDYHELGLNRDDEVYVAMGRVYSGVLTRNVPLYVLDPKFKGITNEHDTIESCQHATKVEAGLIRPYMMMGRELFSLTHAPAGNIVGIVGLHEQVLKTATLTSTLACPSLTKMPYQAKPIVRVAVEPEDPRHFAALEAGLQRLYRSDPTVEVHVQETGEHVIVALGELHLERCIKDLKERFAKVAVRVSEPLVGFKETVVGGEGVTVSQQQTTVFRTLLATEGLMEGEEMDPQLACGTTPDGTVTIQVRAMALPKGVALFLEQHVDELKILMEGDGKGQEILKQLQVLFNEEETTDFWKSITMDQIWSFGPRRVGPNLLINHVKGYHVLSDSRVALESNEREDVELLRKLEASIITGFQSATNAGPLCDEPVWGVAFIVENVVFHPSEDGESTEFTTGSKHGPLSGQVISTMRTVCRVAMIKQPVRLVEAMYECTMQCMAEQLGKLYSVLAKRRGDVFLEELSDGSSLFTIKAYLPVIESFGFATDLLIQTSGAASNPQLYFSHWHLIEMDPFFQPQTEEEREDYGERVYDHNWVRKAIEAIRKRKGLARDEKIVIHAEKQRTLARKR